MFSFGFGGEPGGNRMNDGVPDSKKNKTQARLLNEQALSQLCEDLASNINCLIKHDSLFLKANHTVC